MPARLVLAVTASLALLAAQPVHAAIGGGSGERFVVYYGAHDRPALADADLLVLDTDAHPNLRSLRKRATHPLVVLGYLSLTEVGPGRSFATELKRAGLLLGPKPGWAGAFLVDVRRPEWQRRVVEQIVPAIVNAGFDGLFLDTIDDAPWLENEAPPPLRSKGMSAAAVALLHAIRVAFPGRPLMVNRGFELLPQLERDVDMVLVEGAYATWQGPQRKPALALAPEHSEIIRQVQAAHARRPQLRLYSLDYWDPADRAGVARIYAAQRARGFVPYVSTRELDDVWVEPRP